MNWDAQKMQGKRENKMRASEYSDKSFKSPTAVSGLAKAFDYSHSSDPISNRMEEPVRVKSSGERVADDLQSVAQFAEEVAEFLTNVTSGIVKHYPEACSEDPSAMKADYIPDYFSNLRASTCRIRAALSAIMDVGQRIDL